MVRVYGCIKSDEEEKKYYEFKRPGALYSNSAVKKVDLRSISPDIQDQGTIGSCVSHGVLYSLAMLYIDNQVGSRMFHYYNGRDCEGRTDIDGGMQIINGIKALMKHGNVCEEVWPYDTSKIKVKPPRIVYDTSVHTKIRAIQVPQHLFNIKSTLIEGRPIICGLTLYESFESDLVAKTGIVPMPDIFKEKMVGCHCVCIVGFDTSTSKFLMRNSWGDGWGDNGYFYVDFQYILDAGLCHDLFCLEKQD
jgi:C1A family cysteine protease